MVSVKTKSGLITEIGALVGAVGDKFDNDEADAERDYLAEHCPPRLERTARGPPVEAYTAGERAASPDLDGRSVFGWERDLVAAKKPAGS